MEKIELRIATLAISERQSLTSREVEVLHWSAQGMSYKEIAGQLRITARTVRFFWKTLGGN